MKKIQRFCGVLLLVVFGLSTLHAQTYDKLWKEVEQARKKSLPQTVIKLTDEIYRKGEREQNAPQMLKAYMCREAYQQRLTPDSLYVTLTNMERWAQSEKNPVNKAILHSLLASEYADLMQTSRRALFSRTSLEVEEAPADVREWSTNLFANKIDEHNRASLQDSIRLLDTSSEKYVPFIVLEDGSRFYQHDLYHLLVSRAVSTYGTLGGFQMDSLMRNRIHAVYENMINAYRHRAGSEDAVLLCLLDYWDWKVSGGLSSEPYPTLKMRREQVNKEYLQGLTDLMKEFGGREVCAEVYIKKASYLRTGMEGRSVIEALKLCDEGLKRYPSYKRINELKNIREQILQPELVVTTRESGYPGDLVNLNVRYSNLIGFTLNLYATTLSEVPWMDHGINQDTYKKYARKLSSLHFDLKPLPGKGKLPENVPYLSSDTVFQFQMPQETGVYILQVVPDAGTTRTEDHFLISTRLKVMLLDLGDGRTEVITLDAQDGQPIADTKVSFYSSYHEQNRTLVTEVVTDTDGKAIVPWQNGIRSYVPRKGKDTAMVPQNVYMNRPYSGVKDADWRQVTLLTDRSLYRPGQTVYVKGVAYKQNNDSAQVLEGVDYELVLLDVNRKELASKKVKTNDFGSFTADFILPTACLNGRFSIQTKDTQSTVTFNVEEYKRPTFEINFTPVAEAYRLGESVVLKGNVKAFHGMTVQEVPLAYTVTRLDPRMSYWNASNKPLLADTLQLNAHGDFSIPLTLDAPSVNTDRFGDVYSYNVEAVVTDEAGETQTASYHLLAGSKAYSLEAYLPHYICKEDSLFFTFGVKNRVGVPQTIKGTYQIRPAEERNGLKNRPAETNLEPAVLTGDFTANQRQDFSAWSKLPSNSYSLELAVRDSLGREETNRENHDNRFMLFSKKDTRPAAFTSFFYYKENEEFDAQHPAAFLLGTSYKDTYVLMDVFCDRKRVESRVLLLNDTIIRMEYPYKETYGEGVTLLFSFVKGGKMYNQQVFLKKRQPERILDMKWEVFRDRLRPGQEEEWKLVIKTPQGIPAAAEMLATLYDASLDKIYSHNQLLRVFYPNNLYSAFRYVSNYGTNYFSSYFPLKTWKIPVWQFDRFSSPWNGVAEVLHTVDEVADVEMTTREYRSTRAKSVTGGLKIRGMSNMMDRVEVAQAEAQFAPAALEENGVGDIVFEEEMIPIAEQTLQPLADLRTNFAETAFFYPQLRTNEQGEVAFSFVMPESLTRWNFRGYSHTKNMMTGRLDASVVTAKEFMLSPNMPRFVRVGDKTQVAASIANLTDKMVKGTATFALFDPMTEKIISTQQQKFTVEAGRTTAVNFHFEATDRYDLLGVRMIADGGLFSDGEQHLLPVLSNKEYITETLAMPIRGEETRTFSLDSLFNRNARTATERRLTVEFTGNPAWYAVQALPVLSLPSTDNAISWATAYYANSLAGFIANSQPRIKMVFDSWKQVGGTKETFLSQLEKNQDVKNILLDESPWLLEATTEAEQRARIATLFDVNQLNGRNLSAFTKLKELQGEDGGWSWYKGMYSSRYITGYITELLLRLPLMTGEKLPSEVDEMKQKALNYLNKEALEEYRNLRKTEKSDAKNLLLSESAMRYLYLIAISGEKVSAENQIAYRYFLSKVGNNLKDGTMAQKAQSALILKAAGHAAKADEFIASIKEHLVQTNEMGAYFAFHTHPYSWGMLPIPAHVEVMEALRIVDHNEVLVEEMKLWLLKQKQTTSWNTPVATADAVYALLCQGSDLLESRGEVRITLGNKMLETTASTTTTVPGLSYIKERFVSNSPELKAKSITVEKRDTGIAWGAVYAQYLSPISDVRQQGDELNMKKELYVERVSADGKKTLQPIIDATSLSVGDKVVSRLTIHLDRAMDFVQLKDQRGACFEPIGSLSGYRWNNGFGYYVEVEDAATNFFFDHLGKGVYVLEHSYRIARGGTYETGLATIQCAYAPEYASHSAGRVIIIK